MFSFRRTLWQKNVSHCCLKQMISPELVYIAAGCRPARWHKLPGSVLEAETKHTRCWIINAPLCVWILWLCACSDPGWIILQTLFFVSCAAEFTSVVTICVCAYVCVCLFVSMCVCVSGGGLFGRVVRDFHSGETDQEDLLQTQTLSREVDQHFIWPAHPAGPFGSVRHRKTCLQTFGYYHY